MAKTPAKATRPTPTGDGTMDATKDKLYTRYSALKSERASWYPHWKDLSTYLLPRNGRFFVEDRNRGGKRHNAIYDSTGTQAVRILASGMMAGMTSPARPWFKLTTHDPELAKYQPVKIWLNDVTNLLLRVFAVSNTYNALHATYRELGVFGTGPIMVAPSFDKVVHNFPLTAGEYCLSTNWNGEVDTLYREFERPVRNLVAEFGKENCSTTVQNLYDRGTLDAWVPVLHAIEPRTDRNAGKLDAKNMLFRSVYFERDGSRDRYLRESGFNKFPVLAPRWDVAGGDIYGSSPGMDALGDVKQLQHEQLRKAQAIDFQTKPPVQMPTGSRGRETDLLPGGVSYVDMAGPNSGIKTAFDVNLRLDYLLLDIQDVRERIRGAFYADLFLMLANATDTRMTATEVAERHEEKLLMLGPVLERLHNELLDPMVDMAFSRLIAAGAIPPPPPEMHGQALNVELISMLAQAQKAVTTNGVDRFVGNLGAVAQIKPGVLDKFDEDMWADIYADDMGVDPRMIVSSDQVALVRKQRAQAQAQQQQIDQNEQIAGAAKNLAAVPTRGGSSNAAQDVMNMFSGYGSPSAENY